ncbi:flavoprotein [Saccharopolyspora halophila]|uniref:Flavoprotein n=1 Tax=Saccharopolyspora halophila TaxID=405551 RepID=A0ABN3G4Y8_9PSEU
MHTRDLALIGSGAGGVESLRRSLVEPALARGWRVAVTLTPTAGSWLEHCGERDEIERVTGLPCRVAARLPTEPRPHPPADCYLVCPASANVVAKLALGIADNQALTAACEAVGEQAVPVVVFPRINAAHARHPAWSSHVETLRGAGVHVLAGPDSDLPWNAVLDVVDEVSGRTG